jgi:hypothetical protein
MSGTDLLGFGTNASNVALSRPADNRVFGTSDTYAKDCSTPTAGDGTAILAAWGVGLMQQLRALIRGNGQTAGLVNVITENNANDSMALQAVQQLIQRGQPKFGVDSGSLDALVVALTPAAVEYKQGMSLDVLVAVTNDGLTQPTINVNGLGTQNIIRKGGGLPQQGDLLAGSISRLNYNGTAFEIGDLPANYIGGGIMVTASTTLNLGLAQRAIGLNRTSSPAAMAINLPSGAENGHTVVIEDIADNMEQYQVTVGLQGSGESIAGASQYILNRNNQSCAFRLYVSGGSRIWSRSS